VLAKITGIKLCQAFRRQYGFNAISAIPANLYGPGDIFHPENSHVIPGMMLCFYPSCLLENNVSPYFLLMIYP
jgi:GDP-L-fucose synthase